ncbi:MAG: GntR family transcriptional regulator [Spongiibacteraceae bacterium]
MPNVANITDAIINDRRLGAEIPDQLATRIAKSLEQEIIDAGWPVGQSLGNEEQLVQRFGVSRWVMREALAITERDGLTCMRRGRSGGLFVSAPAESVVATTMRNYLLFAGINRFELLALRRAIDGIACRLAAANNDEPVLLQAQAVLADGTQRAAMGHLQGPAAIYRHILALAGNPLVQIFGLVLSQLTFSVGICLDATDFKSEKQSARTLSLYGVRRRQLECVIGADSVGAIQAAGVAYDNIQQMLEASPFRGEQFNLGNSIAHTRVIAERIVEAFPSERNIRRVDTLTLQIQLDILRLNYQPGDPIAPEKLLGERYEVGRNVLREAIRVLQRDHVVAAAEGRQGGLCVAVPTPDNIVRSNLLLFQFVHVRPEEIALVASELCMLAAELSALRVARAGQSHLAPLLALLQRKSDNPATLKIDLLETLANTAGNPILILFARTVVELQRRTPKIKTTHPPRLRVDQDLGVAEHSSNTLQKLEHALSTGNAPLSRRYIAQL